MASVLSFTFNADSLLAQPTYSNHGAGSGCQAYFMRGVINRDHLLDDAGGGGGAARPEHGQIWPRGNVRGNA